MQFILGAIFLCLVYLIWATFSNMANANKESENIKRALNRLLRLENILVHIHSVEAGQTGFLISSDENFLDPYFKGVGGIKRDTPILLSLPIKREVNKKLTRDLVDMLTRKLVHSRDVIETVRFNGFDSAMAMQEIKAGRMMLDSINSVILTLEKTDREVLLVSNASRVKFATRTSWQLFFLALFFIGIIGVSLYIIVDDFKKIFAAERQLKFNASVIRSISDPVITTDLDNKISNWNSYAQALYGYTEQEVLGTDVNTLLRTDGDTAAAAEIRNVNSIQDFWKGEVVHHHKNGNSLFADVTASAILDELGNKTGSVLVIRNNTERRQAERALHKLTNTLEEEVKRKAAELNSIFERITDAFIALDNDWNYTYVNQKAAELHRRERESLIGKNIWSEFPNVMGEGFYDALHEAKATNKAMRVQLYYSRTDSWFEDLIYPSPDGISVYYHDITEAKKAEIDLQQAHKKLSYHIDNTPMGFVEFDVHFNVKQWSNQAMQIFGYDEEELHGRNDLLQLLVVEEDQPLVTSAIESIRTQNISRNVMQVRNRTRDGRIIYCNWYTSVLKNDDGRINGIMSLVHDVTARIKVQQELEDAELKFRSLVEQAMVGVYILQHGKITYINPKLEELTGYSSEEVVDKMDITDVVFEEDRLKVKENIARRMEGQLNSLYYELRIQKKNGEIITAEVFGTITQYQGEPAIIGTLIDVTDHNRYLKQIQDSEAALQASNDRFLLVAKATNDAVWDWDIKRNTIWGNEVFSRYFNMPVGSLLSYQDFLEHIHPDDLNELATNMNNTISAGQSMFTEEYRFKVQDGKYVNIRDRAYIIFDEQGQALRMLGAMQDVTQQKADEQRILIEKQLSDSIVNSLPGVFYLFNQELLFVRWNKNFEKVTGYSSKEIENMNPFDFFDEEDRERVKEKMTSVFQHGEDFVEARLRAKNGKETPYYFTGRLINYEGETCLMGVGIDVAERVKSQEQLSQSEERYRTIVEQASEGIFISDKNGIYLDVNTNGARLSGYSKEELKQMSIYDLMPDEDRMINPSKIEEINTTGMALNERRLKTKDGSIKPIEISAKLLADGRYLGIVRDISERKKAEEQLRASELKYRLLFEENPMPMWMISLPDRQFLDVNQAAQEFYGYTRQEFLEMTAYDIRPENTLERYRTYEASSTNTGVNHAGIWEHLTKTGSVVKMNIITHNIIYEGKNARLILANDVTQKIEAEEALQKSHEQLRELATHLEHAREAERTHIAREIHDELGQQLTGLKMDISWLNRRLKSQDEEVQKKIDETLALVDGTVKTVRRIATELRPSILDDLGLDAAMEWQSEEFQKRSDITCVFNSNISDITVAPDIATGIFRIYQECLTNVARHSGASMVNAFLQIKDNILVLTILDNGKGFIEREIEEKKTLGLLGMKERAMLLGGSYEITSKPGKGTSVLIIVPLKK